MNNLVQVPRGGQVAELLNDLVTKGKRPTKPDHQDGADQNQAADTTKPPSSFQIFRIVLANIGGNSHK